jgi:hypothetical protein
MRGGTRNLPLTPRFQKSLEGRASPNAVGAYQYMDWPRPSAMIPKFGGELRNLNHTSFNELVARSS